MFRENKPLRLQQTILAPQNSAFVFSWFILQQIKRRLGSFPYSTFSLEKHL
jgi:hypothetical protein